MHKWWRITTVGLVFTVLVLVWIFVMGISANQKGSFYNKGHNAIYIDHSWVKERKAETELLGLVKTLQKYDIDTVFVNVGSLKEDGRIAPEEHAFAVDFLDRVRSINGEIKYQAWIDDGDKKFNLKDADLRHNIAKEVMISGQLVGFDGVQFKFDKIAYDNDFIALLGESRKILPDRLKLSISLKHFTSGEDYKNILTYVDQVVAETYDTNFKSAWWYKWRIREQLTRLSKLVGGKELYLGLASDKAGVEKMENALSGVISGLNSFRSREEKFTGLAIYTLEKMNQTDWQTYTEYWQK